MSTKDATKQGAAASSPSGRALATPAVAVKQEQQSKPEETTTTAAPSTPKAEVPVEEPKIPKQERKTDSLTDGDNSYIASVILAIFSSALSFGSVASTSDVWLPYANSSTKMIAQSAVAFCYLYLCFSFGNTYLLVQTLGQGGDRKKSQVNSSILLSIFNICLLIIAEACYGALFAGVPSNDPQYNRVSFVQACLITAMITNAVNIWVLRRASQFWKNIENPAPVEALVFAHPSISPLLNGNAFISSINLAFAVGAVLFLLGPGTASANQYSSTGWAFTLLYLLSALIASILSVLVLVQNPTLPVKTASTVQWAFALCSFAFALIASGFVISAGTNAYFWSYNQGMIIGGWTISLVTFVMGVTAATLIDGRNCCVECVAAESSPAAASDLESAKKQLEVEKLKLEAAKLARERAAIEAV